MRVVKAIDSAHDLPTQKAAASASQRKLAASIIALRIAVRREPHAAASIISNWLRK
jgi:hypothetical protein